MSGSKVSHVCAFDTLLKRNVPHILEIIFLSLDYGSFKTCHEVCNAWYKLLTCENSLLRKKAKLIHKSKMWQDKNKLYDLCKKGKAERVSRLLKKGVNQWTNSKGINRVGITPLVIAARRGHMSVIQVLLNRGARPKEVDRNSDTLLHHASDSGNKDVVKLFIDLGAIIKQDKKGRTPLYYPARRGQKDVVKLLLDAGADPNVADAWGVTPLQDAALSGHKAVVKLLLHKGAEPNKAHANGQTALHASVGAGHKDVVELLLNHGADPNMADENEEVPLHCAAWWGYTDVVKLLLKRGAKKLLRDKDKQYPLDMANKNRHKDVIKLLKDGCETADQNPDDAADLLRLRDEHPDTVVVKQLDITHYEKNFKEFIQDIKPITSSLGLGCLINNGGTANLTGLTAVKPRMMMDMFSVNVVAPLMLTKALVKDMKYPDGTDPSQYVLKKPLLVNIGSIKGSIGDNVNGGAYPYRITKAAFNMLTKNLALDLAPSGVNAVCVHPGWLRTKMGTERAMWSVEEGVRGMLDNYIVGFDERTHNGEFFHAVKAERLPW